MRETVNDTGSFLRKVVIQLKRIRESGDNFKESLLMELGAMVIGYRIENRIYGDYIGLHYYLKDELWNQVTIGVKKALSSPIIIGNYALQFASAPVNIDYCDTGDEYSVRAIPAHNHIEEMICNIVGGKIYIVPFLQEDKWDIQGVLWAAKNLIEWRGIHRRTPVSPAKCIEPATKVGRRKKGRVVAISLYPLTGVAKPLPLGHNGLASDITDLVNERLARTGKSLKCHIGPFEHYDETVDTGSYWL
jgi:hypothetical protein